ncbi:MAG: AAA family ATPase [Candidatus Sericytochromatia bacterium]
MKKISLGINKFRNIIDNNYLYIDKTEYIYKLLFESPSSLLLCRPKGFGKSLMIDIIKEILSGNKELFKGLWIYDKIKWETYPIIQLDFSFDSSSHDSFLYGLNKQLNKIIKINSLEIEENYNPHSKFGEIIKELSKRGKVVILTDNYDLPVFYNLDKPEIASINAKYIKSFFELTKSYEQYIHFNLLTGISKFTLNSIFSGLNNLLDITNHEKFEGITGFTKEEIKIELNQNLKELAKNLGITYKDLIEKITCWYGGYSFGGNKFLIKPLSVMSLIHFGKLDNYITKPQNQVFLNRLMREQKVNINIEDYFEVSNEIFRAYDINYSNLNILSFN